MSLFDADLKIKKLHSDAIIPTKTNEFDAGLDLYAITDNVVYPHYQGQGVVAIRTGIALEIPNGRYGHICDRSGLSSRGYKIFGGIIDATFRGEIIVLLAKIVTGKDFHLDNDPYIIKKGDRVAQLIVHRIENLNLVEVTELSETDRADKGMGSSGR